jgi:protein-L-isoaspartate O-methyltransferase
MNDENKKFLDYVIKMYAGQENDLIFDKTGEMTLDLPGLPGFIVKKFVYSPGHVNVAMAHPAFIARRLSNKSFLEIGTGTGICGVYCAIFGQPSHVTVTDISPLAVANAQANATRYNLSEPNFRVIESDVYSALKADEKFDCLFWNFPWNAQDMSVEDTLTEKGIEITPERVWQLRAGLDQQYKGLCTFIREGKEHLNAGGEILLGAGTPSRHDIIFGEAERWGYNIEVVSRQTMEIDKIGNQVCETILYRLTVK